MDDTRSPEEKSHGEGSRGKQAPHRLNRLVRHTTSEQNQNTPGRNKTSRMKTSWSPSDAKLVEWRKTGKAFPNDFFAREPCRQADELYAGKSAEELEACRSK